MSAAEAISIYPPLEGEWKFLCPPGHHPDAFDFVQTDSKRSSTHDDRSFHHLFGHIPANRFFCWNQPVLAPISGKVIRVGHDWPDNEAVNLWQAIRLWYNATYQFRPQEVNGRLDIRPNAGNHVMIQAEEGYIVLLAHLRNQSVSVSEGMQVRQGEPVGTVGNSGNSAMPHLHINLFDQMEDPLNAKVLPFVFEHYETLESDGRWSENRRSRPKAGTFVRFHV